jgi:hypothetical protein
VMFKAPWGLRSPAPWATQSTSMERWIDSYPGGWQLLLPNGGEECVQYGVTWGFHGEAAMLPWEVADRGSSWASLETNLMSVPLRVQRELSVEGPVFRLKETVTNCSPVDLELMWSHHPAFGAPLLEAGAILSAGCRTVLADEVAPGPLLVPASRHEWPIATTAAGEKLDLSRIPGPSETRELMAYLEDFESGFYAISNPRLGLGVGLRWPLEIFDKAWLWQEVHSGAGWPWYKRAYVVAVEPASTIPGQGMAKARAKGYRGFQLAGLASQEVVIEAVLFEASGAVSGIDEGGTVRLARA